MGCDIHVVIEKKFGDKWIGMFELGAYQYYGRGAEHELLDERPTWVPCPGSSRNYELFARLAGVRGEGPSPKGLPKDASELATAIYGELDGCSDYHSHSWCPITEYIQHLLATEYNPAEAILGEGPQLKDPYRYYFGMYAPEEGEEFRCVFCFDN
jgi:hypothetical protein